MALGSLSASAQVPNPDGADTKSLVDSVQELRSQVQELRAAVSEMRSEAAEYRAQSAELRKELESMRAANASPNAAGQPQASPPVEQAAGPNQSLDKRIATLEDTTQLVKSELRTQYQTKVESASKYRVRLSGLALLNLFHNRGATDNLDFPTYAAPSSSYGPNSFL